MKLNINNYLFNYKGVDITKLEIKHSFGIGTSMKFDQNTKKSIISDIDWLEFSDIVGIGSDGLVYNLFFDLPISKEEILAIQKGKMVDYSKIGNQSEIYININDKTEFLYFRDGYHIYANPSTLFIGRTDDDKIIFKLSIPEDNLFLWFEMIPEEL